MRIRKDIPIIIIMVSLLSACGTMGFRMDTGMRTSANESDAQSLPGMSNNTRIELDSSTYRASEISHNSVELAGKGIGNTVIAGTLVISGNNARLSGLTVDGSVRITANNADLRDARITGDVDDQGQNNSW